MNIVGYVSLFLFIGIAAALVLLIRKGRQTNKNKIQWYQNWALKLGFRHKLTKYFFNNLNYMEGYLDNYPVAIYEKIIGTGKHQQMYTYVSFEPNPFDFEFSIASENFFSKIGKSFGKSDIEFGNAEFDKKYLLKSKEEAKFRSILDYRAQNELEGLGANLKSSITSNETKFYYSIPGAFSKEEQIAEFEKVIAFMRLLLRNKK